MKTMAVLCVLCIVIVPSLVLGEVTWKRIWPEDELWGRPQAWEQTTYPYDRGVPVLGDIAKISNETTVGIASSVSVKEVYLGQADQGNMVSGMPFGSWGNLDVNYTGQGYALLLAHDLSIDGCGSHGSKVSVGSGSVSLQKMSLGGERDTSAWFELTSSTATLSATLDCTVGSSGAGCFRIAGGTADFGSNDVLVGYTGGFGRFIVSGSSSAARLNYTASGNGYARLSIGARGRGECRISDHGLVNLGGVTKTGGPNYPYSWHPYGLVVGGTWSANSTSGTGGTGFLFLGDGLGTSGEQSPVQPGNSIPAEMTVRMWADASGTVRGWGTVGLTQTLTNNGRIIADGYGQDRTLDMSSFSKTAPDPTQANMYLPPVTNMIPNKADYGPPVNGWFAQNGGILELPAVSSSDMGNATCRWGESPLQSSGTDWSFVDSTASPPNYISTVDPAGTPIDLINSVQLTFPSSSEPPLTIALVAPDCTEIQGDHPLSEPILNDPLDNTYEWLPLGIWRFNGGSGKTLDEIVFRYDDTMLSDESGVVLLRCRKGNGTPTWSGWEEISATQDLAHHLMTTSAESPFVATAQPTCYYAAALEGKRWKGGMGNWTGDNWKGIGDAARWMSSGGTAVIDSNVGSVETVLLGCTSDSSTNTLQVDSGGTVHVGGWLRLGAVDQAAVGTCAVAGTITAGSLVVGENGTGTLDAINAINQTGGTCTVSNDLSLGLYPTGKGTYTLAGGTLVAENIHIGQEGGGTFILGGNTGTGTQSITGVKTLTVRENMHADGELRGWGPIQRKDRLQSGSFATLINNGRIIADGYGQDDRVLDLSDFQNAQVYGTDWCDFGIQNTIENLPAAGTSIGGTINEAITNGWYAVNCGELKLATIPLCRAGISYAASTVNWGESAYSESGSADLPSPLTVDHELDLVNSAQVWLVNAYPSDGGTLNIALLANDHKEVRDIRGADTLFGVWRVDPENVSISENSATRIRFRYDQTSVDPNRVKLLKARPEAGSQPADWHWTVVPNVQVDPVNYIVEGPLTETGVTYFAVGYPRLTVYLVHNLTQDTYWPTIQSAVGVAVKDDVIEVSPSTYHERVYLNGNDITLRSTNPDDPAVVAATVVDGGDVDAAITFYGTETSACTLWGLTITHGGNGGVYGNGTEATIRKCVVRESYGGGIVEAYGLIENCIISHNYSGGLMWCGGTIRGCTIIGNGNSVAGGIGACTGTVEDCLIACNYAAINGGGIGGSPPAVLRNCTIINNTAGQFGGGMTAGLPCSDRPRIENCIMYNNSAPSGPQLAMDNWSPLTVKYCDIQGGLGGVCPTSEDLIWGPGNISSAPVFANGYSFTNSRDATYNASTDQTTLTLTDNLVGNNLVNQLVKPDLTVNAVFVVASQNGNILSNRGTPYILLDRDAMKR